MNKIFALLAAVVAATPAQAGFIIPDDIVPLSGERASRMFWRGCIDEKGEITKITVKCDRIFKPKPTQARVEWKNAKKCEEYTPGCVSVDASIQVGGFQLSVLSARTRRRRGPGGGWESYSQLDMAPSKKGFEQYSINCTDPDSDIRVLDFDGKPKHMYRTTQFRLDLCNSVFPELERDTAYQLKELACRLTKDPKKNRECWIDFKEWKANRRYR
ncbi:hypothetical protein S420910_053 [Synechococcus phage S-CAM7]|uniref:Uncharacterized protein n=1 Tax=Synechococcus phage S-CAM7 TaxID=1883368 RepID=A0A1D8KUE2_9CAUD|nr:hypothetical protein S420910_053 [Synechococcus phage S-CAM7]